MERSRWIRRDLPKPRRPVLLLNYQRHAIMQLGNIGVGQPRGMRKEALSAAQSSKRLSWQEGGETATHDRRLAESGPNASSHTAPTAAEFSQSSRYLMGGGLL
jgi:hypothetical protein